MSIADDLEKVLFGVADKWCQGTYDDCTGGHCLVGWEMALCVAWEARDFLDDYCADYASESPIGFNDSHTQQEVIWMLEEAIDDARERGL